MITLSRKEGSFVNAISYIRNVGKSFGYATIDVLKQHNSTSIAFAKNTKEFGTDLYRSIKDFKENKSDLDGEKSLTGQIRDVVSDMKGNIIEDLKTGNFYNP